MTAVVPKETLLAAPAPQLVFARTIMGNFGASLMIIVILATSLKTFNAGIISVSRFMYSSAREHVLPSIFSRISMRYLTPWVSILTLFTIGLIVAAVTLATNRYMVLVNLAAAVTSIVYALVGIAVISLRRRMPEEPRPYLIPYGYLVPILTTLVFAFLAVALLTDLWVLAYLSASLIVCLIYVNTVVPYLKKKHQTKRPAARRRPSRATQGVEGK
jgi:amino acid transporter